MDKRIFKEKDALRIACWAVILPPAVNRDCYWYFNTLDQAKRFVELVDRGLTPTHANYLAFNPELK